MKKIFSVTFLCLSILTISHPNSFAQRKNEIIYETPTLPINEETTLITYSQVVNLKGFSSVEIYQKAIRWFQIYYKNPTEVIREKSLEKVQIFGKGRFKYLSKPDKKGQEYMAGVLNYSIYFYAKDGRYKYEIKDFNQKAISYTPIEFWMDKNNQKYSSNFDYYLIQLDKNAKEIENSLNEFMKTPETKKPTEW